MPRPDMRAERLPQILAAAMAVFGRSGFAQARMDDIAQEAGLAKATLYLYFSSKDELIAALLEQYFAQGLAELSALGTMERSVTDSLVGWMRRRTQVLQDHPGYLGIGFEFYALATRDLRTKVVIQHAFGQYRTVLAGVLKAAMERREIQPGDPTELAIAIIGLAEGLTMLWMLDPQQFDPGGLAERTIRHLLTGQ